MVVTLREPEEDTDGDPMESKFFFFFFAVFHVVTLCILQT